MKKMFLFILIFSLFLASPVYAWSETGGDHNNQDWEPSCGSAISGTHTNINNFYIPSSCTIYVNGELEIQAYSIDVSGNLNADGRGNQGGTGSGGGGSGDSGGGGAGYGAKGGDGTVGGGAGGSSYGSSSDSAVSKGSGGGTGGTCTSRGRSTSCGSITCPGGIGGKGGGAIRIIAGSISMSGTVSSNGANGVGGSYCGYQYFAGGGGGGSAGGIIIKGSSVSVSGTISANGGSGARGVAPEYGSPDNKRGHGGGGAGGRIKIFYASLQKTGTITTNGGAKGGLEGNNGGTGTVYYGPLPPGSKTTGESCNFDFDCSSFKCSSDYDGSGRFCTAKIKCAHSSTPSCNSACYSYSEGDISSKYGCKGGYWKELDAEISSVKVYDTSRSKWVNAGDAFVLPTKDIDVLIDVKNTGGSSQGKYFVGAEFWKVKIDESDQFSKSLWNSRSERVDVYYDGGLKQGGCTTANGGSCTSGAKCSLHSDPNNNGILDIGETIQIKCSVPASHWGDVKINTGEGIAFWIHETDKDVDKDGDGKKGEWWDDALGKAAPSNVQRQGFESGFLPPGWSSEGKYWKYSYSAGDCRYEYTDGPWKRTTGSYDGDYAALKSHWTNHYCSAVSPISTTVTLSKSTKLSFYWKRAITTICNRASYNIYFYVDGVQKTSTASEDWVRAEVTIPAGTHELKWVAQVNGNWYGCSPSQNAYLDKIEIKPTDIDYKETDLRVYTRTDMRGTCRFYDWSQSTEKYTDNYYATGLEGVGCSGSWTYKYYSVTVPQPDQWYGPEGYGGCIFEGTYAGGTCTHFKRLVEPYNLYTPEGCVFGAYCPTGTICAFNGGCCTPPNDMTCAGVCTDSDASLCCSSSVVDMGETGTGNGNTWSDADSIATCSNKVKECSSTLDCYIKNSKVLKCDAKDSGADPKFCGTQSCYDQNAYHYCANTATSDVKARTGALCGGSIDCESGSCQGSSSYPARCCSSTVTDTKYKDYYCDNSGHVQCEILDQLPPKILLTTTPTSPCDKYPSLLEEACNTNIYLDCQDSESGCKKNTLGYIIYSKEDYPIKPTCPDTGYTTYDSPFLLTDWTYLCTKAEDNAGNINKTLFEIKIDKTLLAPKLTVDETLCTTSTETSCDITLNLNEQANLLVTIGNKLPIKNKVDLSFFVEQGEPYKHWVYFDGLVGEDIINYDFEPEEETSESLIIKGSMISDFSIRLTAEYPEFPEGEKKQYTINVNVAPMESGVTRTPGLNWASFSIIIFLASLIVWKRKI